MGDVGDWWVRWVGGCFFFASERARAFLTWSLSFLVVSCRVVCLLFLKVRGALLMLFARRSLISFNASLCLGQLYTSKIPTITAL